MGQKELFKRNKEGTMLIDNCNCVELVKKYGSPLYVINETELRKKCKMFQTIMGEVYPNSVVCYASKAFCCKYIYNIINEYNLCCDVVSGGEIATVLSSNFNPSKVYFHGNNKTEEEISFALKNKIYNFVVDNFDEIEKLENFIKKDLYLRNKINLIARVNPGIEAHTHEYIQTSKTDSKFGVNIDNGDAEKFIIKLCQNKSFNFLGVHFHIGSQIFDKTPYEMATKKVMEFVYMLKSKHNIDTKVVDAGGGFGAWYTTKDTILNEKDYKNFIEIIAKEIKNTVQRYNLIEPKLIIEPGRSLICEAGTTLYTVGSIKEIRGIRKYVSIDGGMFENPRYALYQAEYTATKCVHVEDKQEKVTIVGKCCESGDIIIKDAKLEKLNRGDIIAIHSTGAYNYSMASNYNRNPVPPVVCVRNGKSKIIVRGQTYKDLIRYDI